MSCVRQPGRWALHEMHAPAWPWTAHWKAPSQVAPLPCFQVNTHSLKLARALLNVHSSKPTRLSSLVLVSCSRLLFTIWCHAAPWWSLRCRGCATWWYCQGGGRGKAVTCEAEVEARRSLWSGGVAVQTFLRGTSRLCRGWRQGCVDGGAEGGRLLQIPLM
jgi:hypothetical protein